MFGPLPGGDGIVFSDDVAKTQQHFARFSKKDADDLSGVRPLSDGVGRASCASCCWRRRRIRVCRDWRVIQGDGELPLEISHDRRQALPPRRPDDDERRRLPVRMVREHVRQGRAGLLLRHRHFRRTEEPRLGLRDHAPRDGRACGRRRLGLHRGGMGAITQAIAAVRARARGSRSAPTREVVAIDTANGRATGVTLADGTRIEAEVVASNVSAKLTFLKFLRPRPAAGRIRARHRGLPNLLDGLQDQHRLRAAAAVYRLRSGAMRLRLSDLHAYRPDDRLSGARL